MNIKKEASCYSTSLLIKHAQSEHINADDLFKGLEEKRDILENRHEWIDMASWIHLFKNYENAGGDLFKAGVETTIRQVSHFQLLFLNVASLTFIIRNISNHFETTIANTISCKVEHINNGILEIIFIPKHGSLYSTQNCDFNRGCTYATAKLKQLRNLNLTEITCAARSDAHECRYRVTWTPDPPILERLKNFFLLRFSSQKAILAHLEETYNRLQDQYKEILGIKDFYSHIMTNMHEGVLWLDAEGKVSFANKGFCSIIRREKTEDLIGAEFNGFLADESMSVMLYEIFSSCRAKPQIPEMFEINYKTSQGTVRVGQTACLWVDSTQQQKPGYLLSIRDITDKRAIERKLYAVENRYRSLYENSPAIIVGIDNDGDILYANPAMEDQSGYSEKELTKMHFSQLVAPEGSGIDPKTILAQRIGKVGLQEMHYRTKSGEWKSVALATFPLYGDKWEVIGLGAIGVDVTETKRLNEMLIQTQRMDLLGQMAGGLAHDFKNLLAVISGYGKLISEISTEPKIQEFANNILLANDRANSLTKNLLTFSRGETVKNEPFVLNEVVEEVKKLLPAILGRKIRLTVELPDNRFTVKGDADKIHQCLLNLCINARDALGQKEHGGAVIIRIKHDTNPLWVLLEVEDTGPGIPPDIIARIFDPFFTTKKKGEGTGLGLSVVYGIVKTHGGDILVDSRPSEGATFTIRLPILHVEALKPGSATLAANDKVPLIIVIDNDVVSRNYCAQILGRQGYTVAQFSSLRETTTWLEAHPEKGAIALIPAVYAVEAILSPLLVDTVTPIWIIENGDTVPQGPYFSLKRPFPPAALVETVRETLLLRGKK
jgi:two-component system, cell cycle sensor histidine kinase and response regulator CckA